MSPPIFRWPNQEPMKTTISLLKNATQMDTMTLKATTTDTDSPTTMIPATTEQTAETTQNILTTVADAITSTASDIVTAMSSNIETTTSSTAIGDSFNLMESFGSNSTGFATNSNSTVLTEFQGSNSTMEENGSTINSMWENITTEANIVTETMKDIITATTEKVISITNNITDSMLMNQNNTHQSPENTYEDYSSTVYIVLGVFLGILIIIFIGLVIIYRKYRKCRQGYGDYCVTQLKEIQSSSSIKTASDIEHPHIKN